MEITVIIRSGISTGLRVGQISIRPAEAGINIRGIISIKNIEAPSTCSILTTFKTSNASIMTSPYMLAGMGSGKTAFNTSPKKLTNNMIRNCLIKRINSLQFY